MTNTKDANGPTELDTFLAQDNSNTNGVPKYKLNTSNDVEAANPNFDPFKARTLDHPVSDCDTLTHLLKATLGTGILSMPSAFQSSGLALGIAATIFVSLICTHCSYVLVAAAHELYKKKQVSAMSFADVAEEACRTGPGFAKKLTPIARPSVQIGIFVTYFITCSCYCVIVASNFRYVASVYIKEENLNLRLIIALLLIPLILLAYVPNLKYLAPVSMVANVFMAIGILLTFYYLINDIPSISERDMVADISKFPIFFSITIFAINTIGVVMPLENNMETPQHFIGLCGVLNQGMSGVTLVYILLGFFGYLKYGEETKGSITLNLPKDDYAAQAVNVLIGLAVFCTFGLQFYVCIDIAWKWVKERCSGKETMANYIMRTMVVVVCVAIAIAVPTIIPFVSLIGAFCFSILGIIFPIFIEVFTFWEKGFGKYNWKIFKNIIVIIVGLLALIFGSKSAIQDIVGMYQG